MYPYLVHIERQDIRDWVLRVTTTNGRALDVRYHNTRHVKLDATIDGEEASRMETWYCRNLAEAELLAFDLAKEVSGRAVYVTELKSIAQTAATPPIISKYTEKGLVPT